jgi:hypothetical protein
MVLMRTRVTADVSISTREEFQRWSTLREHLGWQLGRGRIALVLGAGISTGFGLPDWDSLLTELYKNHDDEPREGADAKQVAEEFRLKYFSDDTSGFLDEVQETLYRGAKTTFRALHAQSTLGAIGAFVMASQRGSVSKVITFNWDNILELFLRYNGLVVQSVFEERHWAEACDVTIYHPHGFLPNDRSEERSSDIIFDRKSYSVFAAGSGRQWREIVERILLTHTCLFVGLSGRDDNLDSMLFAVKDGHAAGLEGIPFWGVAFGSGMSDIAPEQWEERGVFFQAVEDFVTDLPDRLFEVCQEAAREEEG